MFSPEELEQLANLIDAKLAPVMAALAVPTAGPTSLNPNVPVTSVWPFPRPADLDELGDGPLAESQDVAECLRRARYGFGWRGQRSLSGRALVAAWDEVERLATMNDQEAYSYRGGLFRSMLPELAYYALLSGVVSSPIPGVPNLLPDAHRHDLDGKTIGAYLADQWSRPANSLPDPTESLPG